MSVFLLTSTGFHTEEIKKAFLNKIDGTIHHLKVSIITTASPLKELNTYAQKALKDFKEMAFKHIDFVDVEYDDPKILLRSNVIYLNGGNPFHLLFHMKRSGSEKIFKQLSEQNTFFVGVSAGAIILGPTLQLVHHFTPEMNNLHLKDLSCLNLVDQIVFPHYGREDLFEDRMGRTIEERVSAFENLHNCDVHRIRDDQFILIDR